MQPDAEFTYSLVILGGLIFGGLMVIISITAFGIAIYRKKKNEPKLVINGKEKERQNGKATSRGKW